MKLKINHDQMISEFFENSRLLGIVAPQKDYMFIWNINQVLGLKFRSSSNGEIQLTKKNRDYFFNTYEYRIEISGTHHYLYENQHDGEFLLPEFKHLDFLWLIRDCALTDEEFQDLQDQLKKLPVVQMVSEVTPSKIKNITNLLY